ncbi:serine/arginine repetitive matrix protein 2-like isoform X2 [Scylla paramamosain]|uniref:serine/arginine repetitive matrix protein 2-like isoform X2 n=1 Tax=Scylla paramamosain TaxID=85552 RepID=UPI003082DCCA
MFGFFKNKAKDKVVNKDKNSDSVKEKKKDKTNKEDKEVKVSVRKGKEEKASKSIFRKSKSIERSKEGNENRASFARKSQSLDSRDSGEWSDHEELSRQDSGATESEEAALSPGPTGTGSSSEEAARPSSPCPDADTRASDGNGLKNSDSFGSSVLTDSLTSSQEGEVQAGTEGLDERKHEKHSPEVQLKNQTNSSLVFSKVTGQPRYPRTEATNSTNSSVKSNAQSAASTATPPPRLGGVASTLMMKPPLNPRLVAPRGPLATTVTSFTASLMESGGEKDERSLTPSPGMVTPPASPGLLSTQVASLHQNVTISPERPTSPDGRTSMLSTPSSSTSSLSSLTARPISPSGRRTPPGPRMGTGGRLTSSPTANRKSVRTNIKTNPSVASRRAGSHSPVNSPPSPGASTSYTEADSLKTPPSSPVPVRHRFSEQVAPAGSAEVSLLARTPTELTSRLVTFSPPIARRGIDPSIIPSQSNNSLPSPPARLVQGSSPPPPPPRLSGCSDGKSEGSSSPATQRSVSPTVGKTRHSISSMHSLESIPENDSDGQSPVTGEKTFDGDGELCRETLSTPSTPKEPLNSSTTRPSRHSAPEVTPERPHNHGVTHRRTSSLSPVSEERRIHFSVSISETKNVSSSPPQNQARQNSTLDADAEKVASEKTPSKPGSCEDIKPRENKENKEVSKEIASSEPNLIIKEKVLSSSPKEGTSEMTPSNTPTTKHSRTGSLAMVTDAPVKGTPQENETEEIKDDKITPVTENNKMSAAVRTSDKENETTTHVVFRIPFRSKSLANGEDLHQRASVEILPREAGRSKRREKEHCRERPRSVSTSRELRRERALERPSRKRIQSEGTESKNKLPTAPEDEGKKEETKERIRCRSSSSRRSKDLSPDQTFTESSLFTNENDSYDGGDEEVVIPWRKAPRSRSRAIKSQSSGDAATLVSENRQVSTLDKVERTQSGPPTEFPSSEKNSTAVTAPPRQRSKSRGPERRMTRSVTLSELKQADGTKSKSPEPKLQRRARSSSRLQEIPRRAPDDTLDTEKATQDGGEVPQRRRVATKRRSMSARREGEEGVRRSTADTLRLCGEGSKIISSKESHHLNNLKTKSDVPILSKRNPVSKKTEDTKSTNTDQKCSCKKTVETRNVELQTSAAEVESSLCQTEKDLELRFSQQDLEEHTRKELGAQEERYQKQIDELTLLLAEKQEEVSKLGQTLETLKGVQETLANTEELQEKLSLLQQDVRDRNAQLDCARTELETSKGEMELTKTKLKKLEEDLDAARQKNLALQNQIAAKTNCDKTEELETKIKTMEETLKKTTEERDQLAKTIDETEAERDEEIKIIQDALDEAAQEREDLISTFEKEIQNMTTMNSTREQQLMEDFEWKLREMEKDHKKKMEERDRKAEVGHLKSYEAEAIQLRGVTNELQKALRASAREMEHLKVREKILEEEIRGLKKAPASRQSTLQRAKRQAEETEAEFRQKQEKMKNELNAEWEDKLRSECSRLKAELDELHAEEKHLAVESMKVQKEQEIRKLKQSWELRQEEMTKEMSKLKDSLTEKDAYYHKEMENMRTNADRDVWELRRKLQRLDEKNWSAQELLQEKHHEELERIRADYKERMSDLEARLEVAMKDSDEDARQQAEKMHNDEMEHLCEQHRLSMERLREELEAEKFQAVEEARVIVTKHHEYVNAGLREQVTEATNNCTQYREELEAVKSTLALKEEMIKTLEEELARLREAEGVPAASYKDSQSSIASSSESTCSQGSNNSQDRLSLSESVGASIDSQDEAHKSGIYRLVFAFLSLMFLKYILSDIGVTLMGLGLAVLVLSWARARLRKGQAPPARHRQ